MKDEVGMVRLNREKQNSKYQPNSDKSRKTVPAPSGRVYNFNFRFGLDKSDWIVLHEGQEQDIDFFEKYSGFEVKEK